MAVSFSFWRCMRCDLARPTELKQMRMESDAKGNPEEMELEIARRFGRLLSYDDKSVEGLIAKHG